MRGHNRFGELDDFWLPPYFLKTLNDNGWDVVEAKFPRRLETVGRAWLTARGYALTIARRVKELRAQGYRRVVVGGHSLGAWSTLLAEREGILKAEALLINAPAAFDCNSPDPDTGRSRPSFILNATEFALLASQIKTPTVVMLFDGDEFDPGGRGAAAESALTQQGVPHIVIGYPPGFSGHFAGWLPFFDFAYGACVAAFLEAPQSRACWLPPRRNDDFRAILDLTEVSGADKKRIVSADALAGKKFAVYTLEDVDNKHFDYVAPGVRAVMLSTGETREPIAFRDGLQCAGDVCSILLRWSADEILEFDPKSGAIKAWWIEDKQT